MKKFAIIISTVYIAFSVIGCKKDKDSVPVSVPSPASPSSLTYNFSLTVGSYWVYESDHMDSLNNIISVEGIDSVFISSDTIISGKQYFEKKLIPLSGSSTFIINSMGYPSISRDSSGYVVNLDGTFIKHDDFTHMLDSTYFSVPPYYKVSRMANEDSVVTVPAGTFTTINYKQKVKILDPSYVGNPIKYNFDLMANTVGVVYRTINFYNSPNKIGIRLLRYHIAS